MFSSESPHRGNSNEYAQYTSFNIKKKITKIIPNLQLWDFSTGLKNKLEVAVVNEPTVFEPLKFYCICNLICVVYAHKGPTMDIIIYSVLFYILS